MCTCLQVVVQQVPVPASQGLRQLSTQLMMWQQARHMLAPPEPMLLGQQSLARQAQLAAAHPQWPQLLILWQVSGHVLVAQQPML
jgi:hypothetical protein